MDETSHLEDGKLLERIKEMQINKKHFFFLKIRIKVQPWNLTGAGTGMCIIGMCIIGMCVGMCIGIIPDTCIGVCGGMCVNG